MPTDCEQLSPASKIIFARLEPFFPPDPWKNPSWKPEGIIAHDGTFDLRKSADRDRLEEQNKMHISYQVVLEARSHKADLATYTIGGSSLGGLIRQHIEIALILDDLDFQIETGDHDDPNVPFERTA